MSRHNAALALAMMGEDERCREEVTSRVSKALLRFFPDEEDQENLAVDFTRMILDGKV